jgi:hypothetical protein
MSKSLLACAISGSESALVRIKTSGSGRYIITACRTVPVGSSDLAGRKQPHTVRKLLSLADEWRGETLALCVCPDAYFPLNAYFPGSLRQDARRDYCRIEATHFLERPDDYLYDHVPYTENTGDPVEKHLVLFYRAEPFKALAESFASQHPLLFCGSPLQPEVYRSRITGGKAAFLDLGRCHISLTVAENGRLAFFSCHRIKDRQEAEYFAIHELKSHPDCREHDVHASGEMADRKMIRLLEKETSCRVVPPDIPRGVEFSGRNTSAFRSSAVAKAVTTALMAIGI